MNAILLTLGLMCGADLKWTPHPTDKDWLTLFDGSNQVGAYRISSRQYYRLIDNSGKYDPPSCPPIPPPATAIGSDGVSYNGGIDLSKLSKDSPRFTLSGRTVSQPELIAAIGEPHVPDDSTHRRLTIFCDDATEAARLKAEAEKAIAAVGAKDVIVSTYRRDSWQAKDNGFKVTSPVTVYLQDSAGKVIWREDQWPANLVDGLRPQQQQPLTMWDQFVDGLRRVRPDYKPDNDPQINRRPNNNGSDNMLLWVFAGLVLLVILKGK